MLGQLWRLLLGEEGFGRISVGAAMVIALGGGLGAYYVTQGGAPAGTANIWIDGGTGSCDRSATPAAYSAGTACTDMDEAYAAASCGDTVRFVAGSYSAQDLTATGKNCGGSYISFQPASGASVTIREIRDADGPGWIEIQGMTLTALRLYRTSNWRVLNMDGGSFGIGATNIYLSGNDWGPCESNAGTEALRCSTSGTGEQNLLSWESSNVVIDGDTIHDFRITPASNAHFECMYANGAAGAITIRNSRFYNCETYDIYFTGFVLEHQYNGAIMLENNWFGKSCNDYCNGDRQSAINLGVDPSEGASPVRHLLIRFNSFANNQAIVREGGPDGTDNRAIGNIFGAFPGCVSDVVYSYNAHVGGTCGTGDVNLGSLYYVNGSDGAAGDYHLTGGAGSADNLVSPTSSDYALTTDRDGQTRPIDTNRDAGSDER